MASGSRSRSDGDAATKEETRRDADPDAERDRRDGRDGAPEDGEVARERRRVKRVRRWGEVCKDRNMTNHLTNRP